MDPSARGTPVGNVCIIASTGCANSHKANNNPEEQGSSIDGDIAIAADQTLQTGQKLFRLQMPRLSLEESRTVLARHDRLQQLGCVFTDEGELVKYGNPNLHQDFDEMIRVGSVYDDRWNKIFVHPVHRSTFNVPEMWTVLRTLKKVLENEGIEFDLQHQRIAHGDGDGGASPYLVRLCHAYDDLRKTWAASTLNHVPRIEESEANGDARDNGSNASQAEENDAQQTREVDRRTEPQSIGWRFLNDSAELVTSRMIERVHDDIQHTLDRVLEVASAMSVQSHVRQLSQSSAANFPTLRKSVEGSVSLEPTASALSPTTSEQTSATSDETQTPSWPKKKGKMMQWTRTVFQRK